MYIALYVYKLDIPIECSFPLDIKESSVTTD